MKTFVMTLSLFLSVSAFAKKSSIGGAYKITCAVEELRSEVRDNPFRVGDAVIFDISGEGDEDTQLIRVESSAFEYKGKFEYKFVPNTDDPDNDYFEADGKDGGLMVNFSHDRLESVTAYLKIAKKHGKKKTGHAAKLSCELFSFQ